MVSDFKKLQKASKFHNLGINFGWKNVTTLGIPLVTMNLDRNIKISKKTIDAPMNCFIVFVGGRFLKDVDSVVERAKEISEEFYISKPSMYFFEGRHQDIETDLDIPMVKYIKENITFISFLEGVHSKTEVHIRCSVLHEVSRTERND